MNYVMTPAELARKLAEVGHRGLTPAERRVAAYTLTPGGCHACPPMSETERLVAREVSELAAANLQSRNAAAQRALNS